MVKWPSDSQISMFPPYSNQQYVSQNTGSLGAKIADAYYAKLKNEIKDKFLRLSHIAKLTTPEIRALYQRITKDELQKAKEDYTARIRELGCIAETDNPMLLFMSGWQIANSTTKAKT